MRDALLVCRCASGFVKRPAKDVAGVVNLFLEKTELHMRTAVDVDVLAILNSELFGHDVLRIGARLAPGGWCYAADCCVAAFIARLAFEFI